MIQRVVFIRLRADYRSEGNRRLVAEHTRKVFSGISLLRDLVVGVPAEPRSEREWDLVILTRFDDLDAVEEYRTEKTHRAYVDIYLKPMMESIRVWNFSIEDEESCD